MRAANRFAIAVHILTLLGALGDEHNTSEAMAASIGVNPVIVRNVTGMLRRADLVITQQGVAGTTLAHNTADISLLDVYRAVEPDAALFSIHACPNPKCPVGAKIEDTLEHHFAEAQKAMEDRLAEISVAQVVTDILEGPCKTR
ncbi:Rrf2 family transcriptional regulator [bacterium]|nr:Rrf2 family transcriptional regulator [bacterium]